MSKYILLIVCVLLITKSTSYYNPFNFVVWNVGQGSWSTYIGDSTCSHFDMGGEQEDIDKIATLCAGKSNAIYLTHLDWDHISFIRKFMNSASKVCLYYPKKKKQWMESIKTCDVPTKEVEILSFGNDNQDTNSGSIVYLLKKQVLISGDAPMNEEKKWLHKVPRSLRLMLLGHHGSKTSSAMDLLTRARPQTAVASARKGKYGHPHWKVVRKLRRLSIPLLTTEIHGDIRIQISEF